MKYAVSRKNLWEKAPGFVRRGAGYLFNRIPTKYFFGKRYREVASFINSSQWWSNDQIEDYQLAEVRRMCQHAFNNSKFYRDQFDAYNFDPFNIKSLSDIRKLPVIDRETINNNMESILTSSIRSTDVDYVTTGGTTGAPLRFYTTSGRSQIELAYLHAGWARVGYHPDDTLAVLRGRLIKERNDFYHEYDPLLRHHYYSAFHLNDANMAQYITHISSIGDCYLHVYPSTVAYLARYLRRNGTDAPSNVKGIIAESENIYPEQREMVESVFGVRYFSSYGHSEKLIQATECEHSRNYHVWPTYGYFELINSEGDAVNNEGEVGEIVGTGFINHVMPFIRYRTGDYATYVSGACPDCGRNHTLIKDIRGHNTQEHLVAHDGSLIPWSAINMHDETFDNILRFQFEQDKPGYAMLNIIPTENLNDNNINKMILNLKKKFDGRLEFDVRKVKDIPLTKSGKSVFVNQKIQL
jgi:phenylacetate-CoA ligase